VLVHNVLAFVWIAAGLAVFWLTCWIGEKLGSNFAELIGVLLASSVILGLDLLYRLGNHKEEGWERFFAPRTGGALFFLPVWLYSLVAIAVVGTGILMRLHW
jgi:hypothetical protein